MCYSKIGNHDQQSNRSCTYFYQVGKGRILIEGERVALLGYGAAVQSCLTAASLVETYGLQLTVADARFCKPLDRGLIRRLARSHEILITVEEGSIGGFGSHVIQFLALDGLLDAGRLKVHSVILHPIFFLCCYNTIMSVTNILVSINKSDMDMS